MNKREKSLPIKKVPLRPLWTSHLPRQSPNYADMRLGIPIGTAGLEISLSHSEAASFGQKQTNTTSNQWIMSE